MPGTIFSIEHRGRRIDVVADTLWEKARVRLLIDGEQVAETKADGARTKLVVDDFEVRVTMPWWGGSISRAELAQGDAAPVRLRPEAGSRAARRDRFEQGHPRLFAARHVARGVGQALVALVGVAFLLRFLPAMPVPGIDVPEIDLPDLPWPSIDVSLPFVEVPGWIRALLETAKFWGPILIGIVLAAHELRRRRHVDRRATPPTVCAQAQLGDRPRPESRMSRDRRSRPGA